MNSARLVVMKPSMRKRRICLYVAGSPAGPVRQEFGTYVDWFGRLFAEHDHEIDVFDGTTGRLPDGPGQPDAIVITGSPASVRASEPWMEASIELIRRAYQSATPLLGVCFGHQLIGAAFGGSVIRNPHGWQLCSRTISVLEQGRDDPLFAGLPDQIEVNLSHEDVIAEDSLSPANGIEVLAGNDRASVLALRAGPHVRGVQFHPEFSGAVTRAYIEQRRPILTAESAQRNAPEDHPDRLLTQVSDSPHGERVFHNFIEHFIR